jgi:glycosyltransferase involved in cell wall biosynthesis
MGMGGVQRVYNIPKVLKKLGWDVDIYTPYPPYNYHKDISSFNLDELNIKRSFCPDPLHILPFMVSAPGAGKLDHLSFPDNKVFCLPFLWRKINRPDIIVISCPPFSLALTLFLAKKTPCIIDYRDQWTGSYLGKYTLKFEEHLACKIERQIVNKSSAIVTVTKKTGDYLKKKYPGNKNKIHLIRNGYDELAFTKTYKRNEINKFTLTYMGSFSDIIQPYPIFEGFKEFFISNPELQENIVFKYIGPSMIEKLKEKAKNAGLKNLITTGYLPHKEALYELTASDLLILIGGSEKEDSWLIPGKLYQYLRTGLPIIAITKNNEIKDLIGSSGLICNADPKSFADSILKVIQNPQLFKGNTNYSDYSWEKLGENYSELLKNILLLKKNRKMEHI